MALDPTGKGRENHALAKLLGCSMDTILFALILGVLLSMFAGRRGPVIALFLIALAGTLMWFRYHVTETLPLNF